MAPKARASDRELFCHRSVRQSEARIHIIHVAPNIATKLRMSASSFKAEDVCVGDA